MTTEQKLTYSQCLALRECSQYARGEYTWKPKTMEKLAMLGHVERIQCTKLYRPPSLKAYAITDKGREALTEFVP